MINCGSFKQVYAPFRSSVLHNTYSRVNKLSALNVCINLIRLNCLNNEISEKAKFVSFVEKTSKTNLSVY